MTTWDYRITRQKIDDEHEFAVREVYYDDDGKVTMWSEDPIAAHGDTWMECADDLARMTQCMGRPVFDIDAREFVSIFAGSRRRPDV